MKKIIWILLIISIASCSKTKERLPFKILKEDVLKLPLDNDMFEYWRNIQVINDGENDFIAISHFRNDHTIYIYDLKDKNLHKKISYELEGPNGIGKLFGFYYHTKDSIFITNRLGHKMYLTNEKAEIHNSYDLIGEEGRQDIESGISWVHTKSPITKIGNLLYIPSLPYKDPYKYNYTNNGLLMEYDLDNKQFKYLLGYPEIYKNNGYWSKYKSVPSITKNKKNEFIINYPISENIYEITPENNKLTLLGIPQNEFIDNINPLNKITTDESLITQNKLSTDEFYSIHYDPYKNVYYQIARKAYDKESIKNIINGGKGEAQNQYLRVINYQYELIAEYALHESDQESYSTSMIFISKDGLYIKLIPKNDKNEDEIQFRRFTFTNN